MSRDNLLALQKFRSEWKKFDKGDVQRTGRFLLSAKINYSSELFFENDESEIEISFDGREAGRVEIHPTHVLTAEACHLGFQDNSWTDYIFDEDNDTLIIEGSSPKLGGEYVVRIHPVE